MDEIDPPFHGENNETFESASYDHGGDKASIAPDQDEAAVMKLMRYSQHMVVVAVDDLQNGTSLSTAKQIPLVKISSAERTSKEAMKGSLKEVE